MSIIDKLKRTLSNNEVLFKNFFSLTILKNAQCVFPRLTFSYLVRFWGSIYTNLVLLIWIILFLPFIIFLSNVAVIQTMLNLGFKKEFLKIIIFAGIFNVLISFITVPLYFEIGTVVAVVITELFVTFQMLSFLKKNNINVFRKVESNL